MFRVSNQADSTDVTKSCLLYSENISCGTPKILFWKYLSFCHFLNDDSESTEKTIQVLLYRRIINNFCNCKYPVAQV